MDTQVEPLFMRLYWTLSSIPELAALPRKERHRAWRACYSMAFRHWPTWGGWIIYVLCVFFGGVAGDQFVPPPEYEIRDGRLEFVVHSRWPGYLGAGVGSLIGGFIWHQITVWQIRPHLRSYVEDQPDL